MFQKYDTLLKKYKVSEGPKVKGKHNKVNITSVLSHKILENKEKPVKDSKRGETEVRRRPKEILPVHSPFSPNKNLKCTTSQVQYNQFETFDNMSNCSTPFKPKLSFETLQNLKDKRDERKAVKIHSRGFTKIDLTPNNSDLKRFHLPDAGRGNTLNKSQIDPNRGKAASIDSQSFTMMGDSNRMTLRQPNKNKKFANIWASENVNQINRYRKTEEMRGVLNKQQIELQEQKRLEKLEKERELEEMRIRMKLYQQDLRKEAEKQNAKRHMEIEIMKESKDLYQRNQVFRKRMDQLETMKEQPTYLESKEKQERELSHKRNVERKALDTIYKQNIELNKR